MTNGDTCSCSLLLSCQMNVNGILAMLWQRRGWRHLFDCMWLYHCLKQLCDFYSGVVPLLCCCYLVLNDLCNIVSSLFKKKQLNKTNSTAPYTYRLLSGHTWYTIQLLVVTGARGISNGTNHCHCVAYLTRKIFSATISFYPLSIFISSLTVLLTHF